MVQTTSPDNINKWTNGDPTSIVQASQSQGDSVQTALNKRQRYDYVWATSAERTAQTGMVQSSRGYQVDTKTEYSYDNSAWRLATSYAEYATSGQSVPTGAYTPITGWTYSSVKSTDSVFTSISGGVLTIVNPGIYAISLTVTLAGGSTTFTNITTDLAHTDIIAISGFVGSVGTVSIPFLRITASNTPLYLWAFQGSGGSLTMGQTILRVGRIS